MSTRNQAPCPDQCAAVFPGSVRAAVLALSALITALLAAACPAAANQSLSFDPLPETDLRPPALIEAGPVGTRRFAVRFDEAVIPVKGSFAVDPAEIGPIEANSSPAAERDDGQKTAPGAPSTDLNLDFRLEMKPGADYRIAGEVKDAKGNTSRFVLAFTGWNGRPAGLALNELQTGRNSSVKSPHRDYAELCCTKSGNLGGVEVAWASSVKLCRYRFPAAEVRAGDFVVLHFQPEGLAGELDETGSDTGISGGVDSSAGGRDFWTKEGGLPDENGAVAVYDRPGAVPVSGFFYGEQSKSGPLGSSKLADLVGEMAAAGVWPLTDSGQPVWEDAFLWKPSSSRSICRDPASGQWYVTAASGQSPGRDNPSAP